MVDVNYGNAQFGLRSNLISAGRIRLPARIAFATGNAAARSTYLYSSFPRGKGRHRRHRSKPELIQPFEQCKFRRAWTAILKACATEGKSPNLLATFFEKYPYLNEFIPVGSVGLITHSMPPDGGAGQVF